MTSTPDLKVTITSASGEQVVVDDPAGLDALAKHLGALAAAQGNGARHDSDLQPIAKRAAPQIVLGPESIIWTR